METLSTITPNEAIVNLVRNIDQSDHPVDFWGEAITLAQTEEAQGIIDTRFPDLTVSEISNFGEKLKQVASIEDKYTLLLEKTSSGRLWYDVLLGDDNAALFALTEEVIKTKVETSDIKWTRAADIGSGTGNTLRSIAPYCNHVFGVDYTFSALRSAKDLGLPENASLVLGKADELPFLNHSMDLVVSNGLIYYLSAKETVGFVRELSRVIRKGGTFYQSSATKNDDEVVPKIFSGSLQSAKRALIYLLGTIANGGGHPESFSMLQFHKELLRHHFEAPNYIQGPNNTFLIEYTKI